MTEPYIKSYETILNNALSDSLINRPRLVKSATREGLLEFCNRVREAGEAALLDQLLPGKPGNPRACLIARNLNFECTVNGISHSRGGGWGMSSTNPLLKTIAEKLGLCLFEDPGLIGDAFYTMALPPEIGAAAAVFDSGGFDDDLYEGGKFKPFKPTTLPFDLSFTINLDSHIS